MLLAELDGAVGYALVSLDATPTLVWDIGGRAHLHFLSVLPEYRGRRIGSALMERVKEELREAGIGRLMLNVVADNHDAQRFYARHGFVPELVSMAAQCARNDSA